MSSKTVDQISFSEIALQLADFCRSRGVKSYLVGGAVRDAILERAMRDIDLAVEGDATPLARDLARVFGGRFLELDSHRGIARVTIPAGEGVSHVDISLAPDGIHADLGRRDFTVDAMAVALDGITEAQTTIIDPYGGRTDLRRGVIRTVSSSSLSSDPARLLRAVRLGSQLRFAIDDGTARDIRREAHLVDSIAPERVRDEMLKILREPGVTTALRELDCLGLLTRVLPELEDARGVDQPKEHYWDVLDHLLETPGQVERVLRSPEDEAERQVPRFEGIEDYFAEEVGDGHARSTVLKLSALLHDVSKPATKTFEPSGRMRFFGHHTAGAELSEQILRRLRCSNRTVGMVRTMVRYHLRPGQLAQKGELPTPRAVYRYNRDLSDVAVDTLYLNMADYLAARGPLLEIDDWTEHCRTLSHVLTDRSTGKPLEEPNHLIDGHDVMEAFSLKPGPLVGEMLEVVHEAHATGDIDTKHEALELIGSRLTLRDRRA